MKRSTPPILLLALVFSGCAFWPAPEPESLNEFPNHPVADYSEFNDYLHCVHGSAVNMDDDHSPVGDIVRIAISQCVQQQAVAVDALSYPGMEGDKVVEYVDNGVYTLTLSKLLERRLAL